jgi:coiled-coil domain-containing protein 55
MIQREREMEGNEFADKEKFVTQAYKDQMAEVRRAEEEEKKREGMSKFACSNCISHIYYAELERSKKGTAGMTHFYRELLQKSEVEHAATVAAISSSSGVKGPTLPNEPVNLTISKPLKPAVKSDALLAHLAREEGKQIELNDDNQIVDKRELLSAGLNLSGVNTRRLGGLSSRSKGGQSTESVETHRAAGTAASKKEIRERQARLLERQLAEEQERIAQIKEKRETEERERVVKKRNNEEEVQSARQRYLERKRRKVEAESTETSPTVADTG